MAANPALASGTPDSQLPALYAGEVVALQREGIDLSIDGLRTPNGRSADDAIGLRLPQGCP